MIVPRGFVLFNIVSGRAFAAQSTIQTPRELG
jgi:hypothetical protein